MTTKYHTSSRKAWNQAAGYYERSMKATADFIQNGGISMCPPELPFLEGLKNWCNTAIHLQCAGGQDTLSLLNLGARQVIGIDISEEMIRVASSTSKLLNAQASWVCCDVLEIPNNLNATADLIYTGRGAIIWIHDLDRWAHTIARLLKPGGKFYMFEGHPISYLFEMTATELRFDPEFEGYFSQKIQSSKGWPAEYVGDVGIPADQVAEKYERAWPTSEVINALIGQGLRLIQFKEHPDAYWSEFPNMPEAERTRFPNTYSLLMLKELS